MREFQTPEVVANRIRMLRVANRAKSFMIVEGSDDSRPYSVFACERRCSIQWGHGKKNALDVGGILASEHFAGFMVVVDQDEWIWRGNHPNQDYIAWTDGRDLESTLMLHGVIERIIANYADSSRTRDFELEVGKGVQQWLVEWCSTIGAIRLALSRVDLGLDDIDPADCMDHHWRITVDDMVRTLLHDSRGNPRRERQYLYKQVLMESNNLLERIGNKEQLCCGHDLCYAMLCVLQDKIGSNDCKDLTIELFERSVRTAYAWSDFEPTGLHTRIRQWEGQNKPWRILRDGPGAPTAA